MLFEYLALAAQLAAGAAPVLEGGSVVLLPYGGFCNVDATVGAPASMTLAWSVTNPDATLYQTRVYRDGVLVATLDIGTTTWSTPLGGLVQDAPYNQSPITWHLRVDIVRLADGGQVDTQSAPDLTLFYGTCSADPRSI